MYFIYFRQFVVRVFTRGRNKIIFITKICIYWLYNHYISHVKLLFNMLAEYRHMCNVCLVLFLWTLSLSFTSLICRFNAWLKMPHASWHLCKETLMHYLKNTYNQVIFIPITTFLAADSSRVCTSKQNVVSQDVCAHSIPKERTVAGSGVIKRGRIGGESANGLVSLKNRVSLPWTHDLSYKWTNMWEWVLSARAIIYCGGGWKKWKQIIIFPLTHPLWPSVCTDSIPHSIYLVCTLDDLRENRRCVNRLLDSFVITFVIIHPCCAMGC